MRPRSSANSGRLHMPPIDTIMPSEVKLSEYRSDSAMTRAFGLENDLKHWSRMKADGMRFCQEELPLPRLPQNVKERLGLNYDEFKKLEYYGGAMATKNYLWEFGLISWKEKYDYDIRYLQKRFPAVNMKNLICSLFSCWNCETRDKDLPRKYAEGRDIARLYSYLCSDGKPEMSGATETSSEPRDMDDRSTLGLIQADELKGFASPFSAAGTRYSSPKYPDKTVSMDTNLNWENVLLDIQYADHTKGRLAALPLLFLCPAVSIMPRSIQMDIIKDELQKQHVATDDFLIRLQWSQAILG